MTNLTHIAEQLRVLALPISELTPDPANVRTHDRRNLDTIKASLKRFGQRLPIVVQKQGMVVRAGNARLMAAKELGWTHIAALVVDESSVDATAYAIADNRTAELAGWDDQGLAQVLDQLQRENSLDGVGFTEDEIAKMLDDIAGSPTVVEDDVPPPPDNPETCPGDLWVCGNHRLLCGDSRKATDVDHLIEGKAIDLMWTDPPYGVNYVGKTKDAMKIAGDDPSDLMPLLHDAMVQANRVMRPGAVFYIAHPAGALSVTFGAVVQAMSWHLHETLAWVKNSMVLGHSDYHYRHEPILYGWKKGATRSWHGGRDQDSVLEYPRPRASHDHPTAKPVELVARCMMNSSSRGDVVYDPFGGSGTTLIVSERLGRVARTMEIDPRYCDVIVARWENASGRKAERLGGLAP